MGGKRVLSRGVAVRVGAFDHRVEKDESHAGKVMEKRVYERNKDKFPYSRFEMYDPNKKWDTYTVSGAAPRAHLARRLHLAHLTIVSVARACAAWWSGAWQRDARRGRQHGHDLSCRCVGLSTLTPRVFTRRPRATWRDARPYTRSTSARDFAEQERRRLYRESSTVEEAMMKRPPSILSHRVGSRLA